MENNIMKNKPGYTDIGYKRLAAAIVEQACKDARSYPKEVRKFFLSDDSFFGMCMPNTDGRAIYCRVLENFRKYNQWNVPEEVKKAALDKAANEDGEEVWSA